MNTLGNDVDQHEMVRRNRMVALRIAQHDIREAHDTYQRSIDFACRCIHDSKSDVSDAAQALHSDKLFEAENCANERLLTLTLGMLIGMAEAYSLGSLEVPEVPTSSTHN